LTIEAMKKRRSIRRYEETAVSEEQIREILETARVAPSWANKQGWQIIVVRDAAKRQEVAAILEHNPGQKAVAQAPVLIVVCVNPEESGVQQGKEYYMADGGILMDHIMLEAADLGLGTVFIGMFDDEKVRGALGVPDPYRIVGMTPLGVAAKTPGERPAKELDEIVHWDTW